MRKPRLVYVEVNDQSNLPAGCERLDTKVFEARWIFDDDEDHILRQVTHNFGEPHQSMTDEQRELIEPYSEVVDGQPEYGQYMIFGDAFEARLKFASDLFKKGQDYAETEEGQAQAEELPGGFSIITIPRDFIEAANRAIETQQAQQAQLQALQLQDSQYQESQYQETEYQALPYRRKHPKKINKRKRRKAG